MIKAWLVWHWHVNWVVMNYSKICWNSVARNSGDIPIFVAQLTHWELWIRFCRMDQPIGDQRWWLFWQVRDKCRKKNWWNWIIPVFHEFFLSPLHYVWFSRFYTDIFVNPSFLPFCTRKRFPELALNTGILVPKVAYNLPELKIMPRDHIAITHMEHMCITRFAKKC